MNLGKFVFAQVMEHLPLHAFHRCVVRYSGEHKVKRFSCLDQYLSMAFAQLTYRESLRDIEACLRVQSPKLYHLGFRSPVARNTLANANATRDWRIYCDFAQSLIGTARRLYADEAFGRWCRRVGGNWCGGHLRAGSAYRVMRRDQCIEERAVERASAIRPPCAC
jgi:hypothetical protein